MSSMNLSNKTGKINFAPGFGKNLLDEKKAIGSSEGRKDRDRGQQERCIRHPGRHTYMRAGWGNA